MAVTIGRARLCPVLGLKFVVLSHNTIRGAAGASVLNAELLEQSNEACGDSALHHAPSVEVPSR